MADQQTITGKLNKFLYQTNAGWGIALFKAVDSDAQIKIKGQISLLEPKMVYELTGSFETHPKYGKTFTTTSFRLIALTNNEQYLNFFQERIPGVGKVLSKRIIEAYEGSSDLFATLLEHPERLDHVKGLTEAHKKILYEQVKNFVQESKLNAIFLKEELKMEFLVHLKSKFAAFQNKDVLIEETLSTKFYEYAKKHRLQPFNEVDKIAAYFQQLALTNLTRIAWNLNYLLEEELNKTGNTYTTKTVLFKRLQTISLVFDQELFYQGLAKAIELKLIYQQGVGLFSDESWKSELIISETIVKRIAEPKTIVEEKTLNQLIKEVEQEVGLGINQPDFCYDDQQVKVLKQFVKTNLLLLNGGPGTGKTTVVQGMVKLYKKLQKEANIAIAAPTGRAAARLNEIDGDLEAKTVHKLLQANEEGFFQINAFNPLENNLVIIDEASMLESKLLASFFDAANLVDKIVFVGDENQLPSVGYGDCFNNLLAIKEIDQITLTTIHRQAASNGIISLAYRILNNEVRNPADFALANITTNFELTHQQASIINWFENNLQTHSVDNVQVITSFYKGQLGINELNQQLQQVYQQNFLKKDLANQQNHSLFKNQQNFYIDDKVMYLINDNTVGLSNGDVGHISELETKDNKIIKSVATFNDEVKNFTLDSFNSITLSYACSVHKTQGSEYDSVIFVIEKGVNEFFLNKKLVYTAITRAKKHLYIVGDFETLMHAINKPAPIRKTGLVGRINSMLKSEKEYNF